MTVMYSWKNVPSALLSTIIHDQGFLIFRFLHSQKMRSNHQIMTLRLTPYTVLQNQSHVTKHLEKQKIQTAKQNKSAKVMLRIDNRFIKANKVHNKKDDILHGNCIFQFDVTINSSDTAVTTWNL